MAGAPTAAHICSPLQEGVKREVFPPFAHPFPHPEKEPEMQRHHIHRHQIHRDKGREAGRETERLGEMSKETDGQSGNRQNGQRRWPERTWRGCSERQGGQSLRVPGAGGRRDTEAVLRPPPARCPGRSTSLISHLAAPGPVCAEPGIPPAAQTAPAVSLPPPRFPVPARLPGAWKARLGTPAHLWPGSPQLATAGGGAPSSGRGGRGRGIADGASKPGRQGAPIARAPKQCGHRGTWHGLRSDGG